MPFIIGERGKTDLQRPGYLQIAPLSFFLHFKQPPHMRYVLMLVVGICIYACTPEPPFPLYQEGVCHFTVNGENYHWYEADSIQPTATGLTYWYHSLETSIVVTVGSTGNPRTAGLTLPFGTYRGENYFLTFPDTTATYSTVALMHLPDTTVKVAFDFYLQ